MTGSADLVGRLRDAPKAEPEWLEDLASKVRLIAKNARGTTSLGGELFAFDRLLGVAAKMLDRLGQAEALPSQAADRIEELEGEKAEAIRFLDLYEAPVRDDGDGGPLSLAGRIDAMVYTKALAAEANLLAVRGALEEAEVWLTACLECETWQWDADQHDAATACQDRARSALSASQSQPCADGERAARIEAEPSGAEPLSTSERHELECLRHQVGQLEYPCSPHCEGYLRELAMRNGGSRP